ncbi:phage integrase family protein [Duganella vulcania]|uniref:Tyrosine-type recombinase/integrase n=1 Tax=Duganella vulcania TaxID=2692166 RepID=A0A845GH77_9BURK|nr:phage integrase family protein [Duganella vulcania]MYM92782.1 tyrosine-type recombinase/integrase [Duganella vulcania]
MAKTTQCLPADVRRYSHLDYVALRAYCAHMPPARIAQLYYSHDSEPVRMGLESFLTGLLDTLVEQAAQNDPTWRGTIAAARKDGAIPAALLGELIRVADLPAPSPSPGDQISVWFRPLTVRILGAEGIHTVRDLTDLVAQRGPGWWRAIPRIGHGRAGAIAQWLRRHGEQLGELPLAAQETRRAPALVMLDPAAPRLAPLGSFVLPAGLDGHDGINRGREFCFIGAKDDLEAFDCYLSKYHHQPHTLRAYRREVERLVLWSAFVAGKPVSSLLVDDCEAYMRFVENPSEEFRGTKAPRSSKLWKPFAQENLDPGSVKYAIKILRGAFDYLVKVRYLGGNPWAVVADPVVTQGVEQLQIDKALSEDAWNGLITVLERRGQVAGNSQDRVALAAILLMGDSGLRRNEVAGANRAKLGPCKVPGAIKGKGKGGKAEGTVWMLSVLGKRSKWRKVPVSHRTIAALRAHWNDLGVDFDAPADLPLVSPVVIPGTQAARSKHEGDAPRGYGGGALYDLVKAALGRVRRDLQALDGDGGLPEMAVEDIEQFGTTSPHAFRHTFGTLAVRKMPVTVVQEILGHEDSATTSIYVQEKERRIADEAARYYASLDQSES